MIQLDRIEDSEGIDFDKTDESINQKNVKFVITTISTTDLNLIQKFLTDVIGE